MGSEAYLRGLVRDAQARIERLEYNERKIKNHVSKLEHVAETARIMRDEALNWEDIDDYLPWINLDNAIKKLDQE